MNPHLTLTLSPPIGWERRGNSSRTRIVPRRPVEQRRVHGPNACQNLGVEANLNRNPNPGAGLPMNPTAFLVKTATSRIAAPHISYSDGRANSAPREGTRPTNTTYGSWRPRALTRRLEV